MLKSRTSESLVAGIKEAPHWRVLIRPGSFVEERVASLDECWRIIESSRVSLRGWDYPHVDHQNRQNGRNWIESWGDYKSQKEYWRFYQSGQFLHLFSFEEDRSHDRAAAKASSDVPALRDFSPSGYLDAVPTLWRITEVFEFATRLAQKVDFGSSVSVKVEMVEVEDRVLFTSDPARDFSRPYIARESVLSREWSVGIGRLLGGSSDLALDAAEWFFERFQWLGPSRQVLADAQRRLLKKQYR